MCVARTLREGDHRLAGSLETTVEAIRKAGGEARAVPANIAEPADCERLVEAARKAYGPIDVLVNNAALTYFLPIREYPVNKWLASWAVNVHAPFVLSQLALADMIPRRQGAIVNISSGAAIGPGRGPYADPAAGARSSTCYGAEKAALERYTQGLAAEVYQHGVSVTCVSPSQIVPTPGTVFHKLIKDVDDRPGHIQPADPEGVRLDHRRAGAGCRNARQRLFRGVICGKGGRANDLRVPAGELADVPGRARPPGYRERRHREGRAASQADRRDAALRPRRSLGDAEGHVVEGRPGGQGILRASSRRRRS